MKELFSARKARDDLRTQIAKLGSEHADLAPAAKQNPCVASK
jgi:hypothetical protein